MAGSKQHLARFAVVAVTVGLGGSVIAAGLTAATATDNASAAARAAAKMTPGQGVWRVRPISGLPADDSLPALQVDFQPVERGARLKKYQSTRCKAAENAEWTCSPAVDRWLVAAPTKEGAACSTGLDLSREAVPDRTLLEVVDFVQSSSELRDALARRRCSTHGLCDVVAVVAKPGARLAVTLSLPDACIEELVLRRNCSGAMCNYDLVECRTLCA